MSSKYVPPHRRDNFLDGSTTRPISHVIEKDPLSRSSEVSSESNQFQSYSQRSNKTNISHNQWNSDRNIPKNRRRNFSQISDFNVRTENQSISQELKFNDLDSIKIPEIIVPPIVVPINENIERNPETQTQQIPLIKLSKDVLNLSTNKSLILNSPEVTALSPINSSWKISENQIELIKEISQLRYNKEVLNEFMNWSQHYANELENMYKLCVDDDMEFSYDDFVYLAYRCSLSEFNSKKLKHTRPLI